MTGKGKMETDEVAPPGSSKPNPGGTKQNVKRPASLMVDPDTLEALPAPKKRNIELDSDIKVKCLKALLMAMRTTVGYIKADKTLKGLDTNSLNVSHAITSMFFTLHNIKRAKVNSDIQTNMQKKAETTRFKIYQRGNEYPIERKDIEAFWTAATDKFELKYEKIEGKANWLGTMGPYLAMMGAWGYRIQELRVGHMKMPISKKSDGEIQYVPMEKYNLDPSHSVLLEGITYPPERRSSMAMSLGPVTQIMCMLKFENKYRTKWENSVKKTFQNFPCIDDFISLSKTQRTAPMIGPVVRMYADLAMIATTRHSQRAAIPLIMLLIVHDTYSVSADKKSIDDTKSSAFLDYFNCSGEGAFYVYNEASKMKFTMEIDATVEQASQICFHAIFGTYKEDLGILGQMTNTAKWFTREEIGGGFKRSQNTLRTLELPKLRYYSKLCSASQTHLLAGVYSQTHSVPTFSGTRTTRITEDFYEQMTRPRSGPTRGKTLEEIMRILASKIEELMDKIHEAQGSIAGGTVDWKDANHLAVGTRGAIVKDLSLVAGGSFFLGRSKKK